jgi:hypothetical protein
MSLFSKLYIVYFFLIVSICFGQEKDCNAPVTIKTDIENYQVFINGKNQTSNDSLSLSSGIYVIKLIETDGKWNSKEISDTVTIPNCNPINLTYTFSEQNIFLETEPPDAHVIVNDSVIGYTPLLLASGYNNLMLSKRDYADKFVSVDEINKNQLIKLEYIGDESNNSFYGSPKFLILIGTAVALGAATAYYKLKADDSFDKYQITGDPGLLDETDKFDLISGITFTAMQIDFGTIIYFFLTE